MVGNGVMVFFAGSCLGPLVERSTAVDLFFVAGELVADWFD